MESCLFCKIARKEIPSESVFYENEKALAFLDIHPIAPGHTLVVPKEHAENIIDIKDQNIAELFMAVKKATAKLKRALSSDGFTIGINHGKIAGQAVDHLHIHIVPRFKGDGGGSIHTIVQNAQNSSPEEVMEKIKDSN
jgi:histidine triad (HIT) family protein